MPSRRRMASRSAPPGTIYTIESTTIGEIVTDPFAQNIQRGAPVGRSRATTTLVLASPGNHHAVERVRSHPAVPIADDDEAVSDAPCAVDPVGRLPAPRLLPGGAADRLDAAGSVAAGMISESVSAVPRTASPCSFILDRGPSSGRVASLVSGSTTRRVGAIARPPGADVSEGDAGWRTSSWIVAMMPSMIGKPDRLKRSRMRSGFLRRSTTGGGSAVRRSGS